MAEEDKTKEEASLNGTEPDTAEDLKKAVATSEEVAGSDGIEESEPAEDVDGVAEGSETPVKAPEDADAATEESEAPVKAPEKADAETETPATVAEADAPAEEAEPSKEPSEADPEAPSGEDPNKVKEVLSNKKDKIAELKQRLNEIDAEKEAWYKKKEDFGKQIVELIREVKSAKNERDGFTKKVKETKAERLDFSQDLKDKIDKVKDLKAKLKIMTKGSKADPIAIKKQIDKMQSTIETEVMSFEAEKKVMKKIKELQKEFEGSKGAIQLWEEVRTLSKEIDDLKKVTNTSHRIVQDQAKKSQERHEMMIKNSNMIDDLKKQEEEAYKKFFEYKQQFVEVNNELKNLLGEINQVNKKVDRLKADSRREKRKQENMALKDREVLINEKIKKRGKLTTEDLLTMQQIELRKRK